MTEQQNPVGELVIQMVAMPADTNANGDIFGGWLVSHMDMGAAIAARRRAASRVVTAAIEALVFIKPVQVGDTICVYADLLKIGRTSMHLKVETWTLSFEDELRKKVAEGIFIFVAIDNNGKPWPVDR